MSDLEMPPADAMVLLDHALETLGITYDGIYNTVGAIFRHDGPGNFMYLGTLTRSSGSTYPGQRVWTVRVVSDLVYSFLEWHSDHWVYYVADLSIRTRGRHWECKYTGPTMAAL